MNDLSVRATRGMIWSLAENFGLQAIQLVISIVLARLLLPEQFGLIGMLTLFMALSQSLLDSGFGSALIQKKDASQLDICSVFYFNLAIGAALSLLLYAAAPTIGRFYETPVLTSLMRFLAPALLLNALALVPGVLLTKRMDFKTLLKVRLLATLVSGTAGVVMAVKGLGVWSLAGQAMLNGAANVVLLWLTTPWRPALMFSLTSLKTMFGFGSRLLLSGLLETFFQNIYQPLIGKVYSAADVGYYGRAQGLQTMAVQPSGSALSRVLFPALASIQDDRIRLRQIMRKTLMTAAFFQFPLMTGLIVVAGPLITLLLTDRWAPSIPYFQLFCVVGVLYPFHIVNLAVLQATGRSDLFFRLEVIKKILIIANLAITFRLGITALLYGQIVFSIIAYALNSYYPGQLLGYSALQQIHDVYPFALMSLLMGGVMLLVGLSIDPLWVRLIAQVLAGGVSYLGLNYVARVPVLADITRLAKGAFKPNTG